MISWLMAKFSSVLISVPFDDDQTMHEQMARASGVLLRGGHLPLESWFPYLNLGSPQFLHYQSLGAMLTGALGIVIGANKAYRILSFILLTCWPLVIYLSAKIFECDNLEAFFIAAVSPFISSVTGIGYEFHSYLWIGFGLWSQLWGQWLLPLALAFSYRYLKEGKFLFLSSFLTMLTGASHYETAYVCYLSIGVMVIIVSRISKATIVRGLKLLVASFLMSSWYIFPLLYYKNYTPINQVLSKTYFARGYGFRQTIDWLFTGQLLDHNRAPILTILFGVGILIAITQVQVAKYRTWLTLCLFFLLFSCGPTTYGFLADLIPGHNDIFFRRFIIGFDLFAIFLAGSSIYKCCSFLTNLRYMRFRNYEIRRHLKLLLQILSVFAFFSILLVLFSPVINQTALEASQNRDSINSQLSDQSTELRAMQTIITYIKTHPYGRVYAGLPTNWGATFTIGDIPVYQYLESQDVDEVGYTLRTASLMSQPEAFFDDSSLSDYYLFCVRYLIVPSDFKVHVAADVIKKTEFFTLLEIPGVHYFRLVELIGTIEENRYDIGVKSVFYQESSYLKLNKEFEVEWNGMMHLQALSRAENVDGVIVSDSTNLEQGVARAKVNLSRGAVLALSASYDPGWTAYVDKRPTQVLMLAPAIPGVYVPKGDHTIEFHYQGFKYYWELFALLFVTIICVNWGFMRKTKELISRRGLPASEVRSKIYETK